MKNLITLSLLALFVSAAAAEEGATTYVVARMGMQNAATYHLTEVFQSRGRWILPDFYYIDFAHNNYREIGIGGGRTLVDKKYVTVIEELYYDQATGSASGNAAYLVPWTYIGYRIPKSKLMGETVYFPYLPLNKPARLQHVIERAKLEYDFKHFRLGGGYGGYQYGEGLWQQKPFVTTTVKAGKLGNFEFWLQHMPTKHVQVQIRYAVAFKTRRNP